LASEKLHCTDFVRKVQWLHVTGEVDKSVRCSCQIFSGFNVPKIIKIGQFLTELFKKIKKVDVFGTKGMSAREHILKTIFQVSPKIRGMWPWYGPPLARCDTLCTSGFVDDVDWEKRYVTYPGNSFS